MPSNENDIRISGTMTAIAVIDETLNGVAYEAKVVDKNVESVGGEIIWTGSDGYNDDAACKWTNKQIVVSTYTSLFNSAWADSVVPVGTIPVKVRSIALKYNSKVGSPGKVIISVKSSTGVEVPLCALDVGEGCAIPLNGSSGSGFDNDDVDGVIGISQTSNDSTNYGVITLALLGTNA